LKKILPGVSLIALAAVAALAGAYYLLPQHFVAPLIALNRASAGLSEHTVQVGPHSLHYLAGGSGTPVILLHGIFAEKDHWVDFARAMSDPYQLLLPDLPGFGSSGRVAGQTYDYAAQVERLRAWMDAIGVQQAHLAGSSMGGTIAALFAQRYPQRVLSLAFIGAPHGIRTPSSSVMDGLIEAGANSPLIPENEQEFEKMLKLLFAQRPFLPYPIAQRALADALRDIPGKLRIWNEQLADRYLLDTRIATIEQPVLALWGAQDQLFDASGAAVLQQRLPRAEVQLIPDVGHLPMMEVPRDSAQAYSRFLGKK
jgi:pimeloyl-ACP methyl ester carboxylesterase